MVTVLLKVSELLMHIIDCAHLCELTLSEH